MYAHMPDYELVAMIEKIEADRIKKTDELHMEFEKAEFVGNTVECDAVEAEINRLWEAAEERPPRSTWMLGTMSRQPHHRLIWSSTGRCWHCAPRSRGGEYNDCCACATAPLCN